MFKGRIPVGTNVQADLGVEGTAQGTALLSIAQEGASDSVGVAPNGTGSVSIRSVKKGVLRVIVDMSTDTDAGTLEVRAGTAQERITGDTYWSYIVS